MKLHCVEVLRSVLLYMNSKFHVIKPMIYVYFLAIKFVM